MVKQDDPYSPEPWQEGMRMELSTLFVLKTRNIYNIFIEQNKGVIKKNKMIIWTAAR